MAPSRPGLIVFFGDTGSGKSYFIDSRPELKSMNRWIPEWKEDITPWLPAIMQVHDIRDIPSRLLPLVTTWYVFRNGYVPGLCPRFMTRGFVIGEHLVVNV